MAYVRCKRCGRAAFTTAYWSSVDYCDRCGLELPHPRRCTEESAGSGSGLRPQQRPSKENAAGGDRRVTAV